MKQGVNNTSIIKKNNNNTSTNSIFKALGFFFLFYHTSQNSITSQNSSSLCPLPSFNTTLHFKTIYKRNNPLCGHQKLLFFSFFFSVVIQINTNLVASNNTNVSSYSSEGQNSSTGLTLRSRCGQDCILLWRLLCSLAFSSF